MRIVVALGGHALVQPDEARTGANHLGNVRFACEHVASLALEHELVLTHGNGPQVGLLATQDEADDTAPPSTLDVLGAETQGMIGYLVAREMGNALAADTAVVCVVTMVDVDRDDPAFANPSKPIGRPYTPNRAHQLEVERDWTFAPDGSSFRRVVASPQPRAIVEHRQIRWLLERGALVICAGGGGIPTFVDSHQRRIGAEAVVDKDFVGELLASTLDADLFVMATDVDAAYLDWKTPSARPIARAHPDALDALLEHFGEGTMKPKIEAACRFARGTGRSAVIGRPSDLERMLRGESGTVVSLAFDGIHILERE